jgi:hypothetical protein
MQDFVQTWTQHGLAPKGKYPALAKITDDNQDGVVEVNRPVAIDALLAATNARLAARGFPMQSRRLVRVSDSGARQALFGVWSWRVSPGGAEAQNDPLGTTWR